MKLRKEAIGIAVALLLILGWLGRIPPCPPEILPTSSQDQLGQPVSVSGSSSKAESVVGTQVGLTNQAVSNGPAPIAAPVLQQGFVSFQPPLRERAFDVAAGGKGQFNVKLLNGDSVSIDVVRHDLLDEHSGVIYGAADDEPGSDVVLAYVDDAVAGTMFFPQRGLFQVRYAGNGQHKVTQLDPTWSPPCGVDEAFARSQGAADPAAAGRDRAATAETLPAGLPVWQAAMMAAPPVKPTAGSEIPQSTDECLIPTPTRPMPAPGTEMLATEQAILSRRSEPSVPRARGSDLPAPAAPGEAMDSPVEADAATTVDFLVAYTTAAKNANGGDAGIAALINASIATANLAYNNSQIGMTLRLAQRVEVAYTESGSLATDLSRLRNTTDGQLDTVPVLRNNYKADLACLIVHTGTDAAGIAYLWTSGSSASAFAPWGYSVVLDAYADVNLTLAHEVGHNLGCGHAQGDGGSGAFAYSYGHRFTASGTQFRTVMAYAPGTRIPHFSNPNVSYLGTVTGNSSANNALTIANSKATIAAIQTGSTLYQEWSPVAAGDLSGDTNPDLIWRNNVSGRVISWLMDGTNTTSTATLWSGDAAWQPVMAGDFNADGKPDVVWRYSATGRVIVWFMNGTASTGTAALWSGDANWVPIAAADFSADGKPDIVWRNSATGRVIVWFMNGTTSSGTAALWSGDPVWVPRTTGDFNGDGKPDIIWRNSATGRVIVWLMNGTSTLSTAALWTGDAAWVPIASGDFDSDGKPDIVWRNTSTGRVVVWFMNGTTLKGAGAIWG